MTEVDLYAHEPEITFYAHVWRVQLPHRLRMELPTKEQIFLYVWVEPDGLISVDKRSVWFDEYYYDIGGEYNYDLNEEIYEYLTEWELAVWRRIGPEDRELFATKLLDPEFGE